MQPGQPGQATRPPLRLLLSYHYIQDLDLTAHFAERFIPPYPEVFLDSGGFSAATQGVSIDVDAYIAYIKRHGSLLTTYAVLDAVGDARTTRANQRRMEAAGLHPLPTFHVGEDWRYLEEYVEQYPYIALGGMVPYMARANRRALMAWLVRAFKLARSPEGTPRSVYHGFGATAWEVVKAFPWHSVDSTTWCTGVRYGIVPVFDARLGQFHPVQHGDHEGCYRYARQFRELGFDPADFADRSRYNRANMLALAVTGYQRAEAWLRRRHGAIALPTSAPRARPGEPRHPGLNLYLAGAQGMSDKADLQVVIRLAEAWRAQERARE